MQGAVQAVRMAQAGGSKVVRVGIIGKFLMEVHQLTWSSLSGDNMLMQVLEAIPNSITSLNYRPSKASK